MFTVTIEGLTNLDDYAEFFERIPVAASRALNRAAEKARTQSAKLLRQQLNFPSRYLSGADGKIELTKSAPSHLVAKLQAESRPRSLARFVSSSSKKTGVRVSVKPGSGATLPGAFLLGVSTGTSEGKNTILAIRSPVRPRGAYKPRAIGKGLWSLYGPSVAQGLLGASGGGIWTQIEDDVVTNLESEFLRQLKLDV